MRRVATYQTVAAGSLHEVATILDMHRPVDLSDPKVVRWIAAQADDADGHRNRLITRSYYEIGRRLREHLGPRDADWATSAAWASGAVGLIIRRQEREGSRILRLAQSLAPSVYDRVVAEARLNLAEGNRQVYSEVGVAFADFAAVLAAGRDAGADRDFLAGLPPTSRSVPVEFRHYTHLGPAFELYLEALDLDDRSAATRKRKSELIFGANVLVTACEQAGLQPFLDAAFQRIAREVSDGLFPVSALPFVRGVVQVVGYSTQALGQRLVTEYGIKVKVGTESLRVGRSIPRHQSPWCADLQRLTEPRVGRIYREFSVADEDGRRTSAADWTVMRDRMNFIANLFRARQQDPVMWAERPDLRGALPALPGLFEASALPGEPRGARCSCCGA
jgi:hypothetical protein